MPKPQETKARDLTGRPALTLPPLILHPFAEPASPNKVLESSRANLMMQGLLPSGEKSSEDLDQALLDGRYSEIRMLFYVGKDLARWIEQALDFCSRQPELRDLGLRYQSFAALLVNHSPATVQAKLRKWGVGDFRSIFTRALGLNAMLADIPPRAFLADEFIRNYYRYADQLFQCRQNQVAFPDVSELGFDFDIFASGEYSRMLEREWAEG
jgi:hypothetical protein